MKANKKSLFLLLTAFLLCLLPLSACSEAGAQKSSETDSSSQRTVYMEIPIKPLTLGELVQNYYAIAYGKSLAKRELVETPDTKHRLLPPADAEKHKRYQKVTMQVERGIQYCEDGETITYWEIGGLSQDGTYYQPEGFDKSQPGESVLVFRNQVGSTFPIQLQVDGYANVTVPGILLIEEASGGDTSHLHIPPDKTMPLEEYLEKIETLVEKYAQ